MVTRMNNTREAGSGDSGMDLIPLEQAKKELGGIRYPATGGRLVEADEILLSGLQITNETGTYYIERGE